MGGSSDSIARGSAAFEVSCHTSPQPEQRYLRTFSLGINDPTVEGAA